ncbi:nucleolar protein dao-5-like [Anopheles bellator]|uniref:nucleolar protein dao-5-like n=1 Tax=Anopheles bellator TaxID=139047 RepID=UPI002649794B|nr:nucleolar protein dao-5-like [Anopheles bellator]
MKLCLVIVTVAVAVAVATCHALPVPQETVFAVYPVNSALAQHSTDQPFNTQPEQDGTGTTPALSSPVEKLAESKLPSEQPKVLESEESKPTVAAAATAATAAPTEQSAKVDAPSVAAKLAPLVETTTEAKPVEPTTTPTSLGAAKDEATTTEPAKTVPPQTPVPETKTDTTNVTAVKEVVNVPKVLAADPTVNVEKKVPNVSAEQTASADKAPAASEDSQKLLEPAKAEVKSEVSKDEPAKPAEEPKKAEVVEANQARSAAVEEPAAKTEAKAEPERKDDVKSAEPALKPAAAVVEEQPASAVPTKSDLEPTPSSTVPEPKTEGAQLDKPTKVRAAPIVEGLKVSQPVEAEPAVAKIHVTVIQEELPVEKQVAPSVPAQNVPVAVNEVTPVAVAKEVPATTTSEVNSDPKPTAVSETPNAETKSVATEKSSAVESKNEPSESEVTEAAVTVEPTTKVVPELGPIVVVVPSVMSESSAEVTTVVAKDDEALPTTKSEEKPTTDAAPTVRSAPSDDEPKEVKLDDQPPAKAASDGSSQPGSAKVTESTSANSADQGDSDSATTTVTSVTEAELAPTPARLKGKKQIPPNLRGYSKRLKQQEARKQLVDFE